MYHNRNYFETIKCKRYKEIINKVFFKHTLLLWFGGAGKFAQARNCLGVLLSAKGDENFQKRKTGVFPFGEISEKQRWRKITLKTIVEIFDLNNAKPFLEVLYQKGKIMRIWYAG